jgi:transcriptional regulator with XRE-family HTH domain
MAIIQVAWRNKIMSNLNDHIKEVDIQTGDKIYNTRLLLGLSRLDISEATGVSVQQIAKYEIGKNKVSMGVLSVIAEKLGERMDYFLPEKKIEESICSDMQGKQEDSIVSLKLIKKILKLKDKRQRKALSVLVEGLL